MRWTGSPDRESIAGIVDRAGTEAEKAGVEAEERSRFRLSLEELLLRCRDACGEAAEVTLAAKKRGHHLTVELALPTGCSGLPAGDGSPLDTLVSEWKAGSRRGMNTLVYTFWIKYIRIKKPEIHSLYNSV